MKLRTLGLIALTLLWASPTFANSKRLQNLDLPQGASIQFISLDAVQHGHRISIGTLEHKGSVESVLEYFRSSWEEGSAGLPGFIEEENAGWRIISRIEEGWNTVVQLRNTPQVSEAYVSVMALEPIKGWSYKPAMPRDGVLVSSVAGKEFGKATQTDVVFIHRRQGDVASFYRNQYKKDGWTIVSDTDIEGSTAMLAQSKDKQAEIVVTPTANGSVAVINEVNRK